MQPSHPILYNIILAGTCKSDVSQKCNNKEKSKWTELLVVTSLRNYKCSDNSKKNITSYLCRCLSSTASTSPYNFPTFTPIRCKVKPTAVSYRYAATMSHYHRHICQLIFSKWNLYKINIEQFQTILQRKKQNAYMLHIILEYIKKERKLFCRSSSFG